MAGLVQQKAGKAGGPGADDAPDGAGPLRKCLVTGAGLPQSGLIRFVIGPENQVVPDIAGGLPGRGIWLSASRDVVNTACAKGLFTRAAKENVAVPVDLAGILEVLLARRCIDLLGLANRAGQAAAGFEKAAGWIRMGRGGLLVEAADAGRDGKAKLHRLAPDLPRFWVLDAEELRRAFGRDHVVHAVVAGGKLADRLVNEQDRLSGFRGDPQAAGVSGN
ncbi:MAG: RNA-binding protein [Rhodospirillaceae bacterium]